MEVFVAKEIATPKENVATTKTSIAMNCLERKRVTSPLGVSAIATLK